MGRGSKGGGVDMVYFAGDGTGNRSGDLGAFGDDGALSVCDTADALGNGCDENELASVCVTPDCAGKRFGDLGAFGDDEAASFFALFFFVFIFFLLSCSSSLKSSCSKLSAFAAFSSLNCLRQAFSARESSLPALNIQIRASLTHDRIERQAALDVSVASPIEPPVLNHAETSL